MEHLFHKLNQLKRITPDADFIVRCRRAVVRTEQHTAYWNIFTHQARQAAVLTAALAMAVAMVFVVGGVFRLHLDGFSPELVASLNSRDLLKEQQDVDFQLQLAEAKYYEDVTRQVTMALTTVFPNDAGSAPTADIQQNAETLDKLLQELTL